MQLVRHPISVKSKHVRTAPLLFMVVACLFLITATSSLCAGSCPLQTAASGKDTAIAMCAFSNPSFSGLCKESAPMKEGESADDACNGILQCLNDVRCQKTYCGGTTIREGWKVDSAKESEGKNSTLRKK
ncbi:MAG: hypothetical protein WBN92_18410 [Terriglobia bacterium]